VWSPPRRWALAARPWRGPRLRQGAPCVRPRHGQNRASPIHWPSLASWGRQTDGPQGAELFDAGEECGAEANAPNTWGPRPGSRRRNCKPDHGGWATPRNTTSALLREVYDRQDPPVSREIILNYIAERVLASKEILRSTAWINSLAPILCRSSCGFQTRRVKSEGRRMRLENRFGRSARESFVLVAGLTIAPLRRPARQPKPGCRARRSTRNAAPPATTTPLQPAPDPREPGGDELRHPLRLTTAR